MKTGVGLGLVMGSVDQPAIVTDNNWASVAEPGWTEWSGTLPFLPLQRLVVL